MDSGDGAAPVCKQIAVSERAILSDLDENTPPPNEKAAPVTRKVVKPILGVNLVRLWWLLIDPGADNQFLSRKNKTSESEEQDVQR